MPATISEFLRRLARMKMGVGKPATPWPPRFLNATDLQSRPWHRLSAVGTGFRTGKMAFVNGHGQIGGADVRTRQAIFQSCRHHPDSPGPSG